MVITEPKTAEDFEKYYHLRWEILRKPWDKPKGSEKDDTENSCIHAMAIDDKGDVVAVCRLQYNSSKEAQIRYMAVKENTQGKGIGSSIIRYIENKAMERGIESIVLHAREKAVNFYKSNGYKTMEISYLMWEKIQHFLMKKTLIKNK